MARGRLDEARQVLESYATKSGKTVNTKTLETMVQEVKDAEVRKTADQDKPQYMDLLRTRKMRKRTVVSCFNWYVKSQLNFLVLLHIPYAVEITRFTYCFRFDEGPKR